MSQEPSPATLGAAFAPDAPDELELAIEDARKSADDEPFVVGDTRANNKWRQRQHRIARALVFLADQMQSAPSETGEIPLCDGHAAAWFTERNHLKGDHGCVVCAFKPSAPEPTVLAWCVQHEGECLGDHPAMLDRAKAELGGEQPAPRLIEALEWALKRIRTSLDTGDLYAKAEAALEAAKSSVPSATPCISDQQERDIWDKAIKAAVDECFRLDQKGKDDHRNSWIGNAVAAIVKLYAPDLTKDSEY